MKNLERVEAYGDVDELNSFIGALCGNLPQDDPHLAGTLQRIQSDLLHIGAWLATSPASPRLAGLRSIRAADVRSLETAMDTLEPELAPLTGFILPGGHAAACWAHVARTVCRRAERHVVKLAAEYLEDGERQQLRHIIAYLNRLSDYLFVLARYCNHHAGIPDILWGK